MDLHRYLMAIVREAYKHNASDIHLVAGVPPAYRINSEIVVAEAPPMTAELTSEMVFSMLNPIQREALERDLELCFSTYLGEYGRFRVTVYYQAGHPELSIRRTSTEMATRDQLGLPRIIEDLVRRHAGLILITGPTGVGKTTTMNFMIDLINSERRCKIVTIEDPIEYVHHPKKAIIVQQEVRADTHSFSRALMHVLRQDPDVICVGEMRDLETIGTALTAAETGHLVLATLHTPNALQTIERIVSAFPSDQQNQVIAQLANSLQGVIAQLLLPRADRRGRVLACEVLTATTAVRSIIRENSVHQLLSVMQTGKRFGMQTMDNNLREIYERAEISHDVYISHCQDQNVQMKEAFGMQ